ncbi:uncharacterized protein LOC129617554 [Condylostylus longicornis]|uniref:uncharacterized protein LOC129617554 n=1 Tax=Condylostylus longicornis TaxID=2530218 RepID=UPI00244E1A48|nr:uncharacterized protein LOC129617554 [Condylostylus longicornis]
MSSENNPQWQSSTYSRHPHSTTPIPSNVVPSARPTPRPGSSIGFPFQGVNVQRVSATESVRQLPRTSALSSGHRAGIGVGFDAMMEEQRGAPLRSDDATYATQGPTYGNVTQADPPLYGQQPVQQFRHSTSSLGPVVRPTSYIPSSGEGLGKDPLSGHLGGSLAGQLRASEFKETTEYRDDDFEDEPPLLEELGINPDHIVKRMKASLLFYRLDHDLLVDVDMCGPVFIAACFGCCLLLVGRWKDPFRLHLRIERHECIMHVCFVESDEPDKRSSAGLEHVSPPDELVLGSR